jgi:hypothetical protein
MAKCQIVLRFTFRLPSFNEIGEKFGFFGGGDGASGRFSSNGVQTALMTTEDGLEATEAGNDALKFQDIAELANATTDVVILIKTTASAAKKTQYPSPDSRSFEMEDDEGGTLRRDN